MEKEVVKPIMCYKSSEIIEFTARDVYRIKDLLNNDFLKSPHLILKQRIVIHCAADVFRKAYKAATVKILNDARAYEKERGVKLYCEAVHSDYEREYGYDKAGYIDIDAWFTEIVQ